MSGLLKSKQKTDQTKILLIDDEPDLADTIKCRLESNDFDVVTAFNKQEGLEKAADEKPDLILLDTDLLVSNVNETIEQFKKHQDLKDIPVIMCTALCDTQDIAATSACGIAGYVTKPFDYTDLIEKITSALKNKKS
jgi:DNA-binding response OmpR family regulator